MINQHCKEPTSLFHTSTSREFWIELQKLPAINAPSNIQQIKGDKHPLKNEILYLYPLNYLIL